MATTLEHATTQENAPPDAPDSSAHPSGLFDVFNFGVVVLALLVAVAVALQIPDGVWSAQTVQVTLIALLSVTGYLVARSVDRRTNEDRRGWMLMAYAVNALVAGELSRQLVGGGPFPSFVDAFTITFAIFGTAGLLLLPHAHDSTAGRVRLGLDALAGTAAISALIIEAVLFTSGSEWADVDLRTMVRPTLALVLCAALLVTALRRSPYRNDLRLMAFGGGVALWVLADVVSPADDATVAFGLRLAATALFAVMALAMRRPVARRLMPVVRTPVWKLVVPYGFVAMMYAAFFVQAISESVRLDGPLPWAAALVAIILIVRQVFATRENRQLIERERDQLIASVSHELRTPLTAVTGFADIIWEEWGKLSAREAREMMDIIRSQSHHLSGIVTDIVALVRDELDTVRLEVERVEAREIVADAIKAVFDLNGGPLPVTAQVEAYMEVTGDRTRLTQMLVALLKNAQRYGRGKILVVATRSNDGRRFEVHDNGEGVPPRYEHLIWDRFERGEHTLNSNVAGSGLGLAIVRAVAKAHGGRADYQPSDRLGGACFSFEIPYEKADVD